MDKTIESMVNLCKENKPSLIKVFGSHFKVQGSIISKYWLVVYQYRNVTDTIFLHNIFYKNCKLLLILV